MKNKILELSESDIEKTVNNHFNNIYNLILEFKKIFNRMPRKYEIYKQEDLKSELEYSNLYKKYLTMDNINKLESFDKLSKNSDDIWFFKLKLVKIYKEKTGKLPDSKDRVLLIREDKQINYDKHILPITILDIYNNEDMDFSIELFYFENNPRRDDYDCIINIGKWFNNQIIKYTRKEFDEEKYYSIKEIIESEEN